MNYKPIFYVNGILLLILALGMMAPMTLDWVQGNPEAKIFASSLVITAFIGFMMIFVNQEKVFKITIRETFLMTCLSWTFMAAFSALPLALADINLSPSQAFFEAMSGVTTTGATVIPHLDSMPHGILLWRSILQWFGGIGFLVVALAILPLLQISGMQVFKTQSFDVEKVMPRASHIAGFICLIYTFLTITCGVLLRHAGMSNFDAICHALTTMATGGFSTHDQSIGYFNSFSIELIVITFMLLSSFPFILYIRMMKGDVFALTKDSQIRSFLTTVVILVLLMSIYLIFTGAFDFFNAMRHALFMVTALATTSGFASQDYALWGPFVIAFTFFITPMGACSGSTTGGIKIFRFQMFFSMLKLQIRELITPHGVFHAHYNKKPIDLSVQNAVGIFFFVFIVTALSAGLLLMMTGLDFLTAFSAGWTAVSNVGPGLGNVGPAGNYSGFSSPALWVMAVCMLLGRLEIFTVLVLLAPRFWRQ